MRSATGDVGPDIGEGPSLGEIARKLTTPARSGVVLTRERFGALARDLSLPVGFGERSEMLLNLFRAAAELERLPELLGALRGEADRWDRRYFDWTEKYPASQAIWDEWRGRLVETRALLDNMAGVAMPRDTPPQHPALGSPQQPCNRSPQSD